MKSARPKFTAEAVTDSLREMLVAVESQRIDPNAFTIEELLAAARKLGNAVSLRTMVRHAKNMVESGQWDKVFKRCGYQNRPVPAYRKRGAGREALGVRGNAG